MSTNLNDQTPVLPTNFSTHLVWGIITGIFFVKKIANIYFFRNSKYGLPDLCWVKATCWYVIGSIQPDVDQHKLPTQSCTVKNVWATLMTAMLWWEFTGGNLAAIFSDVTDYPESNFFLLLVIFFAVWFSPFLVDTLQRLGLFKCFWVQSQAGHRGSVFHSYVFWGVCQLSAMYMVYLPDPGSKILLFYSCVYSAGVLAHIFLDHLGTLLDKIYRLEFNHYTSVYAFRTLTSCAFWLGPLLGVSYAT